MGRGNVMSVNVAFVGYNPAYYRDLSHRNVRFGSKADICGAIGNVRFTPDSDRESGFPRRVMSALPPKADMCGATSDVR
jgi:hypothetical protein